jgi:glycosyltransferase A (GT-A) superfamily protein (DUF2064 family)
VDGNEPVCILGSDAPTLPPEHVAGLIESAADVTLGPAEDGGYWGICFRRVMRGMFEGVEWSSAKTLNQTVEAAHRAGLTTSIGSVWWDVDEPDDLQRLLRSPDLPRHIAEWRNSRNGS